MLVYDESSGATPEFPLVLPQSVIRRDARHGGRQRSGDRLASQVEPDVVGHHPLALLSNSTVGHAHPGTACGSRSDVG